MADLPISSANIDVSTSQKVQTNPVKSLNQAAPNLASNPVQHTNIPSQVISKTPNELMLSLPNQPPLRIDLSNNADLASKLNIGDKIDITIAQDKSSVVITITRQVVKPTPELTLPLDKRLIDTLKAQTSLPPKDSVIHSHIEKNGALLLGQARRLPQEKITLKVSDNITIKEKLPGVNALPLNTTMQTSLVLGSDKQLLVEFTKRAAPTPSIQLVIPLEKLSSNNKALSLQALPISKVAHISEVLTPETKLNLENIKDAKIDMSKPLNQLWLRHQPAAKILGILSHSLQEVSTLSREQIKAELSLQMKQQPPLSITQKTSQQPPNELQNNTIKNTDTAVKNDKDGAISSAVPKNPTDTKPPIALNNTDSSKQPLTTKPEAIPLPLKDLGLLLSKQQLNDLIKTQPKELNPQQNISTNNGEAKNISNTKQGIGSSLAATTEHKPLSSLANASSNSLNKGEKSADKPNDFSSQMKASAAQQATGKSDAQILEKQPSPVQDNKDTQAAAKHTLKNEVDINAPKVLKTKTVQTPSSQAVIPNNVISSKNDTLPSVTANLMEAVTPKSVTDNVASAKQAPSKMVDVPLTKGTSIHGEQPEKLASQQSTTDKTPSVSLQKLNALIGALHSSASEAKIANQHTPAIQNAAPLAATGAPEASSDELVAIEQLKSLSQRLNKQLPAMSQLTNPAQLSQLVEQFSRFEPLSSASINLSSLGPLASALQLILGGRHAAQEQAMSPQLIKHLNQLMKKTRGASASNLTSALQMLGNLKSFKPLEEALTNISSNIQFYQYQNAEQQQNNQSLFYFNLPTKEPHVPQVEGEVEQQESNEQQGEKTWRLTLLLPCGESDQIKVNALLSGNGVELELTCNNQSLLERANFYKNFLASRLEALGFETPKVNCQQGEIPTTLLKRPNQLVELMV